MLNDELLKDYFNLEQEKRKEIMDVVCKKLHEAYTTIEVTSGKKEAKQILNFTLTKEKTKALKEENYEYAEIINHLVKYMSHAIS
jgi:O-glycosyl hydrolase